MKHLSEIAKPDVVVSINQNNIAHIHLTSGWVKRKVSVKPFSNFSIATVIINKEKYLIDDRIDVVHV